MHNGKIFSIIVSKDMVEAGNILDVAKAIHKLENVGVDSFQKVAIAFHGYDDSSTEVWEVPEIRQWCKKLVNKIPYLFYCIENDFHQTQQTLMLCLNDFEYNVEVERKSPEEWDAAGVDIDEIPQHLIKIHVHQKSMRLMFAEMRKHAKKLGKAKNAERVIEEMSAVYGVSTD